MMADLRSHDESQESAGWSAISAEISVRPQRPLTGNDRAKCEQAARRITVCLRDLYKTLPEHARSATGMSRFLGIVRNTCQRIVTGLADEQPGASTLVKLPGVEGLRHFVNAVADRVSPDPADIAAANNAIDQVQAVFREIAGSQLRLADRLKTFGDEAGGSDQGADPDLKSRQAHFNASAALANEYVETYVDISVLRAIPEGSTLKRERLNAIGHIGRFAREGARPLINSTTVCQPGTTGSNARGQLLDQRPASGALDGAVIEEFSTSPLPVVTGRVRSGELRMIIDPKVDAGTPVTVVSASRMTFEGPLSEYDVKPRDNWIQLECPARHLVFDLYLHRDMAARYVPHLEVLLNFPPTVQRDRWTISLPNPPRLELLGLGTSRMATRAYTDHARVTSYLFEKAGWDPQDYVGYRCETPYPIWLAFYNICLQPTSAGGQPA